MIDLKALLFYYFASMPTFAVVGAIWAAALKGRGENIKVKHGTISLLVLQAAAFLSFGLGSYITSLIFKLFGT